MITLASFYLIQSETSLRKTTSPIQRFIRVAIHFCFLEDLPRIPFSIVPKWCCLCVVPFSDFAFNTAQVILTHWLEPFSLPLSECSLATIPLHSSTRSCFKNEWHGPCDGFHISKYWTKWFFIQICTKSLHQRQRYVSDWSNLFFAHSIDAACHRRVFSHSLVRYFY